MSSFKNTVLFFLLLFIGTVAHAQYNGGNGDGSAEAIYEGNFVGNTEMYFGGTGDGDASAETTVIVPVPVSWLYFNAHAVTRQQVLLQWATAMEENNSHFELERSTDGHYFESLHMEAAAGNSNDINTYSYADVNIPSGVSRLYYRLRQVDFDGQNEEAPLQVVDFTSTKTKALQISIYPNPFSKNIMLQLPEVPAEKLEFRLADMQGRILHSLALQKDVQMQLINLPTNLPAGMYVLQIIGRHEQWAVNVMKED